MTTTNDKNYMYRKYIKRLLGFSISLLVLILFFPLMLVISLSLYLFNRGEVIFRQERVGYKGKTFIIYKFKSMNDARDKSGVLLPDTQRTTLLGKFLRKTSLDELPQLINILKGDMNLIGPRPLMEKHLKGATEEQLRRLSIKPGVTGWAQINGRNTVPFDVRFNYDVHYVDNCSLFFDAKIMMLTIINVLKMGHYIYQEKSEMKFEDNAVDILKKNDFK